MLQVRVTVHDPVCKNTWDTTAVLPFAGAVLDYTCPHCGRSGSAWEGRGYWVVR